MFKFSVIWSIGCLYISSWQIWFEIEKLEQLCQKVTEASIQAERSAEWAAEISTQNASMYVTRFIDRRK